MSNNNRDIEFASSRGVDTYLYQRNTISKLNTIFKACTSFMSHSFQRWYKSVVSPPPIHSALPQVEDFRRGYPRFTALLGAHPPYFICRRFSVTRARLLLMKQDRVSILEQELEQVDKEESLELFLGNSRRDRNPQRKVVLEKLDDALAEYDDFVQRCEEMLKHTSPQSRDVVSLQNWIESTACLARSETAYLARTDDLLSIITPADKTMVGFEQFCENKIIAVCKWFKKEPQSGSSFSRDPHIYAVDPTMLRKTTRTIMAMMIVIALMLPVVIVNSIANQRNRMISIICASAMIVIALTMVTKITTWEMFVGAATYATVMVVFVQNQETTMN